MEQAPARALEPHVVEDRLFDGALRLWQPEKGHRAGTDAVLLAAMLPDDVMEIVDLGAASGVVGLRAAQMNPAARVTLIEREPGLARLAEENISVNGLPDRVSVREQDVLRLGGDAALRERFDCVLTNPPYLEAGKFRRSGNANRERAHMLEAPLADWLRGAVAVLAPKGKLFLIHRAEAIGNILDALGNRCGDVACRFVHPRADKPAIRVLLSAVKGSRAPLTILPPVILNGAEGFTPEAARWHAGTSRLDMKTGG